MFFLVYIFFNNFWKTLILIEYDFGLFQMIILYLNGWHIWSCLWSLRDVHIMSVINAYSFYFIFLCAHFTWFKTSINCFFDVNVDQPFSCIFIFDYLSRMKYRKKENRLNIWNCLSNQACALCFWSLPLYQAMHKTAFEKQGFKRENRCTKQVLCC